MEKTSDLNESSSVDFGLENAPLPHFGHKRNFPKKSKTAKVPQLCWPSNKIHQTTFRTFENVNFCSIYPILGTVKNFEKREFVTFGYLLNPKFTQKKLKK